MIAHQGGWDEIWLPAGMILLAVIYAIRRRKRGGGQTDSSHCLYCGRDLPPDAERCDACGFKRKGTDR
jgi:hypothetical protein